MVINLNIAGTSTGRRFTDPIRYFKANDPYYWEVDNIPIKQLQENCRYLRDRLDSSIASGTIDINRVDIAELRPFANNDSKVYVNPGRYTARINNTHAIDNLENFIQVVGGTGIGSSPEIGKYTNYSFVSSVDLNSVIDRIKSTDPVEALGLNGLSERAFAFMAMNPFDPVDAGNVETNYPQLKIPVSGAGTGNVDKVMAAKPFPITETISWFRYHWWLRQSPNNTTTKSFGTPLSSFRKTLYSLAMLENCLVKYWRGTARTAIVDVPNELSIEVPPFSKDDFYYYDYGGVKRPITGATSRIDLVFIYSKPVDVSAVSYFATDGVNPMTRQTTTTPVLGLLKGAGVGLDEDIRVTVEDNINPTGYKHKAMPNGIAQMLPSIADQNNTDMGFDKSINQEEAIRGSFPSPEDLLNLAPILSEKLSEDSWFLTGQTVFPVAYIKVSSQASLGVGGLATVTNKDIVDIRPLFRTSELTYNERAGIAAAMPPLSIANRAVGKYELEHELIRYWESVDNRLQKLELTTVTIPIERWQEYDNNHIGKGTGSARRSIMHNASGAALHEKLGEGLDRRVQNLLGLLPGTIGNTIGTVGGTRSATGDHTTLWFPDERKSRITRVTLAGNTFVRNVVGHKWNVAPVVYVQKGDASDEALTALGRPLGTRISGGITPSKYRLWFEAESIVGQSRADIRWGRGTLNEWSQPVAYDPNNYNGKESLTFSTWLHWAGSPYHMLSSPTPWFGVMNRLPDAHPLVLGIDIMGYHWNEDFLIPILPAP